MPFRTNTPGSGEPTNYSSTRPRPKIARGSDVLALIAGGGYDGPGRSPDRADAMVWGVSEVLQERAVPRVTGM